MSKKNEALSVRKIILLGVLIINATFFSLCTVWFAKLIIVDAVSELGNILGVLFAVLFILLSSATIYGIWHSQKSDQYLYFFDVPIVLVALLWVNSLIIWLFFPHALPLPTPGNIAFISACKELNGKTYSAEGIVKLEGWCMYDRCTIEKVNTSAKKAIDSQENMYVHSAWITGSHFTCIFSHLEKEKMSTSISYYSD